MKSFLNETIETDRKRDFPKNLLLKMQISSVKNKCGSKASIWKPIFNFQMRNKVINSMNQYYTVYIHISIFCVNNPMYKFNLNNWFRFFSHFSRTVLQMLLTLMLKVSYTVFKRCQFRWLKKMKSDSRWQDSHMVI